MFKSIYLAQGASVFKYDIIEETKDGYLVVPINAAFKVKKTEVYEDKFDAMYALFVKKMNNGSTLQGYKASKYYEQYIKRAKERDPELLL